ERQLARLMELAEKEPGETRLAGLERAGSMVELFAAQFEFRARPFDFATRDRRELARAIASYRSGSERIGSRVYDRDLWIDGDARRAAMRLTAEFGEGLALTGDRDAYRFQIGWVEENGEWRIDLVDLVEVVPPRP
ncbi:MAG: hypothetical protein ACRD0X_00055, partial [Thermoanaerobaculia bacterium]